MVDLYLTCLSQFEEKQIHSILGAGLDLRVFETKNIEECHLLFGENKSVSAILIIGSKLDKAISKIENIKKKYTHLCIIYLVPNEILLDTIQKVKNSPFLGKEIQVSSSQDLEGMIQKLEHFNQKVLKSQKYLKLKSSLSKKVMTLEVNQPKRRHLLEHLLNEVPIGIVIIDEKKRIVELNQKSLSFGCMGSIQNALEASFNEFFDLENQMQIDAFVQKAWDSEKENVTETIALRHDLYCELKSSPIHALEGQAYRMILMQDISSRIQYEQRIREMNNDLEERVLERTERYLKEKERAQEASEAKSVFLSTMSHELRTPLNGIVAVVDILKDSKSKKEDLEWLGVISKSSRQLSAIISNILDFTKIESNKLDLEQINFNFKKLLKSITDIYQLKIRSKKLEFKNSLCSEMDQIFCADPVRLRQVIENLMENAIKYTSKGSVEIRISVVDENAHSIEFKLEVIDSGIGIKKSKLKGVFDPFLQADSSHTREYGGTGLGLAICEKMIHLMGGEIGVTSVEEVGSTFWCTFSLLKSESDQAKDVHTQESKRLPIICVSGKILIVEDNKINQKVMKKLIKSFGLDCVVANDGQKCLEILKDDFFDLILMDLQMPVMNGIEATKIIKSSAGKLSEIPIVAITANAFQDVKNECKKVGMSDFLTKPVKKRDVQELLYKYLS